MTASYKESEHVLRAHVFVVRFEDKSHDEVGCIAETRSEALESMGRMYAGFPCKVSFFGVAQAVMQPAIIEWCSRDANWRDVRHKEKGFYAFLNGIFFCRCGDHEVSTHCQQRETHTGWTAIIYGENHDVRPL